MTLRVLRGAAAAVMTLAATAAAAQSWPAKSVRIIVPFGTGGGTDIQGRLLGKKFFESMGQTFVVDNRAGAGGMLGAELAAKSPPDGYTLLFTTASLAVGPSLYKKLGFDPVRDLAPVSWVSSVPLVLAIHPSVPAKSVKDLVALAKARKGQMNAASNGSGTTSHLTLELLKQTAGIQVAHIPYKGGGPATTAVLSGEVDFVFTTILSVYPQVKAGRLRALGVSTLRPVELLPDLPTIASSGVPDFEAVQWYGIVAPARTPPEVIALLNTEVNGALGTPAMKARLDSEGAEPVPSTPEAFGALIAREIARWRPVIEQARMRPE